MVIVSCRSVRSYVCYVASRNTSASTVCCTSSADRFATYGRRAFAVAGPMTFNTLPNDLRDPSVSTAIFGQLLKTRLFYAYQHV